ncbi:MAG: hypothetical protein ACI8RD_008236 [Bacillariaceae sp.]|jgi:hypothetical protein
MFIVSLVCLNEKLAHYDGNSIITHDVLIKIYSLQMVRKIVTNKQTVHNITIVKYSTNNNDASVITTNVILYIAR